MTKVLDGVGGTKGQCAISDQCHTHEKFDFELFDGKDVAGYRRVSEVREWDIAKERMSEERRGS